MITEPALFFLGTTNREELPRVHRAARWCDRELTFLRTYRSPDREPPMRPITPDEKQLVLSRLIKNLTRLRTDAGNLGLDMLAFILATAQDEAQGRLQKLEGEAWPEDE